MKRTHTGIIVALMVIVTFLAVGCNEQTTVNADVPPWLKFIGYQSVDQTSGSNESYITVYLYEDTQTRVEYIVSDYGRGACITPRLGADGKPVLGP